MMFKITGNEQQKANDKWGGSEKVIQYWSCHCVNLIDDYVVSR